VYLKAEMDGSCRGAWTELAVSLRGAFTYCLTICPLHTTWTHLVFLAHLWLFGGEQRVSVHTQPRLPGLFGFHVLCVPTPSRSTYTSTRMWQDPMNLHLLGCVVMCVKFGV